MFLRRLLGTFGGQATQKEQPTQGTFTVRDGRSVPVSDAFKAWTSGDFHLMTAALRSPAAPVDRHHLLCAVVEHTFRLRRDRSMSALCAQTAEAYIAELPSLVPALREAWKGVPLNGELFKQYATLLTEQGNFDRALQVCAIAQRHQAEDGTQGGFAGRIKRIEKSRAKVQAG